MKKSRVLVAIAALGAILATAVSAASRVPYLQSVSASHRHVVAVYALGPDLAPARILVAAASQTSPNGQFVRANIRLSEPLRAVQVAGRFRTQTRHTLRAGRYFVEVSGVVVGLDCTPTKPCRTDWSNVRRVVIRP